MERSIAEAQMKCKIYRMSLKQGSNFRSSEEANIIAGYKHTYRRMGKQRDSTISVPSLSGPYSPMSHHTSSVSLIQLMDALQSLHRTLLFKVACALDSRPIAGLSKCIAGIDSRRVTGLSGPFPGYQRFFHFVVTTLW